MTQGLLSISNVLSSLIGKPAWGFTRTHGSMFFLELGDTKLGPAKKKRHGEWHFLFQMCHWKFENENALLVGSDDLPELIDEVFGTLQIQQVDRAELCQPSNDLQIAFSSGICLRTVRTVSSTDEKATQWYLFDPSDGVWIADLAGRISLHDANAEL